MRIFRIAAEFGLDEPATHRVYGWFSAWDQSLVSRAQAAKMLSANEIQFFDYLVSNER